jgi:L-fuculose-phosphate aldolase
MGALEDLRLAVVDAGREMLARGLTAGTAGNISARVPGAARFLVTPSGVPYAEIGPPDLVLVDLATGLHEGTLRPSVETPLHMAVLQARPDVNAVLHTHSTYASVVAAANHEVPPILDSMAGLLGGSLEVAPYALSGSDEMTAAVVPRLERQDAVLLGNHGAIMVGRDLATALALAQFVEQWCQVYVLAQALGGATVLPTELVARERGAYLTKYGQRPSG